jgi:NADPH:quinone reductase-like Zn-dependent oxidoreductase
MAIRQYNLKEQADKTLSPVMAEREKPSPGPGELLIRMRACSLNYRDLLVKSGRSASPSGSGIVPVSDGAGEVEAIGEGVTQFKPGDAVIPCFFRDWKDGAFDLGYHKAALGGSVDGVLSEYVVAPESGVVPKPETLNFREAACLPIAALTAWHSLIERGRLRPGQTVLTLGTGGVSIFALQIATAKGARVIVTSSSDEKLERARKLGAWKTINYRKTPDWDKAVWDLTEKRGADHVIEVGGPGTLGKSMNACAAGGNIALIGVLTGFEPPRDSLFPLVTRNIDLHGIYVGSRAMFERMNAFLSENGLQPVIDRDFSFDAAIDAYAYLKSGQHFGKVVITV